MIYICLSGTHKASISPFPAKDYGRKSRFIINKKYVLDIIISYPLITDNCLKPNVTTCINKYLHFM